MKLDLRPKTLSIKGFTEGDPLVVQAIKDWYEVGYSSIQYRVKFTHSCLKQSGAELESFETVSPDELRVQFKTRGAAEQVCCSPS